MLCKPLYCSHVSLWCMVNPADSRDFTVKCVTKHFLRKPNVMYQRSSKLFMQTMFCTHRKVHTAILHVLSVWRQEEKRLRRWHDVSTAWNVPARDDDGDGDGDASSSSWYDGDGNAPSPTWNDDDGSSSTATIHASAANDATAALALGLLWCHHLTKLFVCCKCIDSRSTCSMMTHVYCIFSVMKFDWLVTTSFYHICFRFFFCVVLWLEQYVQTAVMTNPGCNTLLSFCWPRQSFAKCRWSIGYLKFILLTNRKSSSHIRPFDWYQNLWPWMRWPWMAVMFHYFFIIVNDGRAGLKR